MTMLTLSQIANQVMRQPERERVARIKEEALKAELAKEIHYQVKLLFDEMFPGQITEQLKEINDKLDKILPKEDTYGNKRDTRGKRE